MRKKNVHIASTCRMENSRHTQTVDSEKIAKKNWKEQSSRTEYCISVFVFWKGINWVLRIDNWTIEIKPLKCTRRSTHSVNFVGQKYTRLCKKVRLLLIYRIPGFARALCYRIVGRFGGNKKNILQLKSFGTNKYTNNDNLYVISSAE